MAEGYPRQRPGALASRQDSATSPPGDTVAKERSLLPLREVVVGQLGRDVAVVPCELGKRLCDLMVETRWGAIDPLHLDIDHLRPVDPSSHQSQATDCRRLMPEASAWRRCPNGGGFGSVPR